MGASSYKGWKELERRHAKLMNGVRLWRPDFGESAPDGESDRETWDAKYTVGNFWATTTYERCERKYREFTGDRNFHLVLFAGAKKRVGDLVVCTSKRYAELLEKEALLDSHLAAFTSMTEEP